MPDSALPEDEPLRHLSLLVAAGAAVVGSLVLARNIDPVFLAGVLAAPALLALRSVLVRRDRARDALIFLRESWGKRTERTRDPEALGRLFVACEGPSQSAGALDDATWNDLDLDTIFAELDRTLSAPGEYLLYETLRTPRLDGARVAEREAYIAAFERSEGARDALRRALAALGRSPLVPLTSLLFGPPTEAPPNTAALAGQSLLPLVGVASFAVLDPPTALLLCIGSIVMNAITHFRIKNEIATNADGIRYLAVLVRSGDGIGAVELPADALELQALLERIAEVAREARAVGSKGTRIGLSDRSGGGDVFQAVYEYVSIFFLLEVRNYYAVLQQLAAGRPQLQQLFRLIGEVDAWQSVASWRSGLSGGDGPSGFCRPEFVEGRVSLAVEDAVHPLLEDPVPNSFDLSAHSVVVTGSNMAGKSTLLRTVGLASILAQTVHTVPATRYVACPLRVASSVTIRDDISTGRSFYLAEAERLLRLLRFAEEEGPALVLVDEPLRGTNSTERIAAVSEILLHLAEVGALTVVATHELQIAELVAPHYAACHLGDEVDAEGLSFPHRILPGVATSRNAIRLLGQLGYPEALVASAEARAGEIDRGGRESGPPLDR